eukprot:Plantae.Rhodophyta-Purpureofilum_apyrenoidigerum.ctg8779.p1 GENE.Plantae.Rhodophyta-Purpureofilum_apyrenoidigerum.ctg8779~~Plantae.Rhodophyta-Purpureofilum_apyrenoidigerum.ctg8779.p1  ORF type:complete len:649 (+),score=102.63 Plantae.Rhodophyta-Purpureofilum_apyrenoidigerum.ctg8779:157-2103(+)
MGHPLDPLDAEEIIAAAETVRQGFKEELRFNTITLREPGKQEVANFEKKGSSVSRSATVVVLTPRNSRCYELVVSLDVKEIVEKTELPLGTQPPFTPDDCFLAEEIVKSDVKVQELVKSKYDICDLDLLVCDPWSVHLTADDVAQLKKIEDDWQTLRLVQTFLYRRDDADDNHYAHPIDLVPIVDLNSKKVVLVDGEDRPASAVPAASVNYHRNKLSSNTYLQSQWREDVLKPLEIIQKDGPSFSVEENLISWQKWQFRIGFNSREGLVLYNVTCDGRSILSRASLVEMAVPYGDPHPPFQRKCAFDVGDYGLGFCANSLELGCDCLGYIKYFDAVFNDSAGAPKAMKNVVCMHEEDYGLLWKHVEYRNGHSEARRSRRLVLSFIATVVNYEYLFYWYFMQDGTIEYEIKLSGELSTNVLSRGEDAPEYGVLVAPGVNAQVHQHMFCVRLDFAIDGLCNSVCEVDVEAVESAENDPYGNAFKPKVTLLSSEEEGRRCYRLGRTWKIMNPNAKNSVNNAPVSYRLVPFTRGPSCPALLTKPNSAVSTRGQFATESLWVTPFAPEEKFPAGTYPTQAYGSPAGLPVYQKKQRSIENTDVVVWHSFGVVHVPRVEDFPIMPCEMTGFSLKPDGFFKGNPAIDLPPTARKAC